MDSRGGGRGERGSLFLGLLWAGARACGGDVGGKM